MRGLRRAILAIVCSAVRSPGAWIGHDRELERRGALEVREDSTSWRLWGKNQATRKAKLSGVNLCFFKEEERMSVTFANLPGDPVQGTPSPAARSGRDSE